MGMSLVATTFAASAATLHAVDAENVVNVLSRNDEAEAEPHRKYAGDLKVRS